MADKAIMKQIAEQKLKAFSIGTMGKRPLSKKELEEQRKKEQEQAAAQAFEEFVATFQETPNKTTSKVWVKAGTYDAGKRQEDTREKGKLYKPQSKISELVDSRSSAEQAQEYARLLGSNERKLDRLGKKKKEGEKKKSNLELFKEELKMIQEEREERHKYKGVVKNVISTQSEDPMLAALKCVEDGSFDNGDPNTTNLYLGNLNPKITEQQLMEIFGKYGPLASIKIMWPRSDEEKARQRNCGFVAFMSRKDGERALKNLNGRDIMQYEMKLGWGKSVPIPPYPIYIPPALMEITQPPPPSGLPFNAQPHRRDRHKIPRIRNLQTADPQEKENFEKVLQNAVVKVVIPTERNLVMLIHRMVEFVIREGPMFEAMIMNRELNNPMFRFLFENYSPAHIYYRWKLYSILQGDGQKEWRTEDFRMFKGGSVWRPPPINPWTQGMPDELIEMEERQEPRRGSLSNSQRDRLEDLLRNISPERIKVAEAMVFCIEHAEAAEEICDCISESLSILQTPVNKKIARLYLISDILHNCGVKVNNATIYRKAFETRLLDIFNEVHQAYKQFDSRLKAEGFKVRVMRMFRAWEDWAVYPRDFLVKLQNTFLGLVLVDEPEPENDEDIDGAPLSDVDGDGTEDLDGVPLDGAALLKGAMKHGLTPQTTNYDDIDGVPMDEDIDGVPMDEDDSSNVQSKEDDKKPSIPAGFVPSRWETVDPDQVEAQAMTTSKWEELGQNDDSNSQDTSMDSSGRDYNEERRSRLREIEVKIMQYQDELESGRRTLKSGMTIQGQVEHYRKKLIRKSEREMKDVKSEERDDERRREKKRSTTPESPSHYRDRRRNSTSPSSKSNRYRSRSRSPRGKRRSRSPYKKRVPVTPSPPRIRRTPSPSFSSRVSRRSPTNERNDRKRRGSRIFHDRSRFFLTNKNILPINNTQINDFSSKSMKVAILGARSKTGNCLSLFLKQSPLIDELAIFDNNSSTYGLALDLNYIDTKCKVSTCNHPEKCLEETLQGAKIVMIVTDRTSNESNEVLKSNAIILSDLLPNIIKFSPQAMLAIVMNPINSLIPLTMEMYKKAGIYEYNRIFGVMNFECLKANSFTADLINIEPECTMIPVIGGGCSETCIPLFSQAKPSNKISQVEARRLTYAIRMSNNNTLNPSENKETNSFALSYAAARFCMSLCKALRHQGNVVECAYVRSCAIPELTYFAAPLELGPNGIQKHLDIPPLNDYECELLKAAVPRIKKAIKLGETLALGDDNSSSELCLNNLMSNPKCFS